MNWILDVVPPKIRNLWNRREIPENLWSKCPKTGELVYHSELKKNAYVFPNSGYHLRLEAKDRLEWLFDGGEYNSIKAFESKNDPLKFRDSKKYTDRLKDARSKTGINESIIAGYGKIEGRGVVAAVHSFAFMGGTLSAGAGEMLIAAISKAAEEHVPFLVFTASGGARMQEGTCALMQMPRVVSALQILKAKKIPYIVVLTNPTMGGVTASYAMLGDIHIAEPGALVGFAGARVINQTIRVNLPDNFQTAEYLLEHGMVDLVLDRRDIKGKLIDIFDILQNKSTIR